MGSGNGELAAISAGWESDVLTAKIAFVEKPHVLTLRMRFNDNAVAVTPEVNVSGPTKRSPLVGVVREAGPAK